MADRVAESAPAQAPPGAGPHDAGAQAELEALRLELAKWQARVPKLAAALRERTEEAEGLRQQVAAASRTAVDNSSAGIRARDDLIAELESKVDAVSEQLKDAQGRLHSRELDVAQLKGDVDGWKRKWQGLTRGLDDQAAVVAAKTGELERLQQQLATSIQDQASLNEQLAARNRELAAGKAEVASLQERNDRLFETTEFANSQLDSLGGNLKQLREQIKTKDQQLSQALEAQARTGEERTRAQEEATAARDQLLSRDQEIESLRGSLASGQRELEEQARERQAAVVEAQAQVHSAQERAAQHEALRGAHEAQGAELEEARVEVGRLEECVERAAQAHGQSEQELAHLSDQLSGLAERNQRLEAQLAERSSLVVALEQEKRTVESGIAGLEQENAQLGESLEKAQRHAADHAGHVAQLDAHLERQRELMANLERELAETRQELAGRERQLLGAQTAQGDKLAELSATREQKLAELTAGFEQKMAELTAARDQQVAELEALRAADAARTDATAEPTSGDEATGEAVRLRRELLKAEGMLRQRTSELNEYRWREQMAVQEPAPETSTKTLVVLNQQLAAARDENQRLLNRLHALERSPLTAAGSTATAVASDAPVDDLTCIRGVGPKLAAQLNEIGIKSFAQIAAIGPAELDDEHHPLYAHRARILRDDWLEQAARLAARS